MALKVGASLANKAGTDYHPVGLNQAPKAKPLLRQNIALLEHGQYRKRNSNRMKTKAKDAKERLPSPKTRYTSELYRFILTQDG